MSTASSTDGSIYAAAMAHGSDPATMLQGFWVNTANDIRKMPQEEFKTSELPLARIKKIMKLDEDVKMISAEAPVLFAKAAEIFVAELTLRAWIHTEDNKRRTLQRNDIATAITKYDQFDFLIDIVPREELKPQSNKAEPSKTTMLPEQVQYYFQLAQQQQQQQQTSTATTQTSTQQVQSLQDDIRFAGAGQVLQHQQQYQTVQLATQSQQQAISLANAGGDNQQVLIQSSPQQQQQQMPQVFQQVITANGEVQNIPIQLTAAQLQAIQLQMQNKQTNQPMVLQTASGNDQQIQFVQQPTVYQIPLGQQQVYIQQESTSSAGGSQHDQSSEEDCNRIILTEQVKT